MRWVCKSKPSNRTLEPLCFRGPGKEAVREAPRWGLSPGPSVYRADAPPLSYNGGQCTRPAATKAAYRRRGAPPCAGLLRRSATYPVPPMHRAWQKKPEPLCTTSPAPPSPLQVNGCALASTARAAWRQSAATDIAAANQLSWLSPKPSLGELQSETDFLKRCRCSGRSG